MKLNWVKRIGMMVIVIAIILIIIDISVGSPSNVVISLDKSSIALTVGETDQLSAAISFKNATSKSDTEIVWLTSNATVATVDNTGTVTAVGAGNVEITASAVGENSTTECNVVVMVDRPAAKLLFTFDDGDISNLSIAAPILYQKGFKGTAYVGKNIPVQYWSVGKLSESDMEKLYSFYDWDLGNHTLNHLEIGSKTDADSLRILKSEYLDNQNWILSKHWTRGAYHVAYPHGDTSDALIGILRGIGVKTARTVKNGIQTTPPSSLYRLVCIDAMHELSYVKAQIDSAVSNGTTVILMVHGISAARNDFSMTTDNFQAIVDYASQYAQQAKLDVTTISEWYNSLPNNNSTHVSRSNGNTSGRASLTSLHKSGLMA